MTDPDWCFDVFENGVWVAGGSGPDRRRVISEAAHYVQVYGQDGGDVKSIVYPEGDRPPFPPLSPQSGEPI